MAIPSDKSVEELSIVSTWCSWCNDTKMNCKLPILIDPEK